MLIGRKILVHMLAGVFAFAAAANAFSVDKSSNHRNGEPAVANSSHARTRPANRHHHRHRSSARSKRVPKAKSLEKESW